MKINTGGQPKLYPPGPFSLAVVKGARCLVPLTFPASIGASCRSYIMTLTEAEILFEDGELTYVEFLEVIQEQVE